ncbi:F0F1 ATP synthase subunit delta [Herbaspirillum sp. RV1423]|uniref:F0F1 ATP synthase subunit delta n=1 Tax=Herbaspirillum sp. RV1423 TaxID=1443993 RepID=UPI0004B07EFD|nr:F0F1 ATP synthase subunit delta [Herbaspirillum sp. RV1423]
MKFDWWTLALQTINVLVLLWVLQHFLFRPVQAMIAQRQKDLQKLAGDAATEKQNAAQQRLALEGERNALAGEREQTLAAARSEAREAGQALLAQAAGDIAQRNAAAQAALGQERAEAESALQLAAAGLAENIVKRLLERLPEAVADEHFLPGACEAIAGLGAGERKLLLEADARNAIEVVSAHPLAPEAQATMQQTLNAALGSPFPLHFSCDAALLAGIELRFRHVVVSSNWAADLRQIMATLTQDQQASGARQ